MDLKRWTYTPGPPNSAAPTFEAWEQRASRSHATFRSARNEHVHWQPLAKPLEDCTVALVTSGGIHGRDDLPFDTAAHKGDWSLRRIPRDVECSTLVVSHTHYNHGDADEDVNCMLPIDRLNELADSGRIGSVAPSHYSLMGFIPDPQPLLSETVPTIVEAIRSADTDVAIFSPG